MHADSIHHDDIHYDDHLDLLASMSRDFAATLDIESALHGALKQIVDYLDAEAGALFLLDDDGKMIHCRACVGPVDITGITVEAGQGIVGRSVANNESEIVRDVAADPNFNAAVDKESGFTTRSILCAPMSVRAKRIGAIEVLNKRQGDHLFSHADLRMLQALASSAAMATLNARMARALVDQERVRRELELASDIQRRLLPEPRPAPFPVCGVNVPARSVSGDFYDFFELPDGRIYFTVGDVSGKGMDASLLMAKTSSLFHCLGKTIHSPGKLLGLINAEICETAAHGKFVTMAAGLLDPATGIMVLANAGHEPPLLRHPDGRYEAFEADAPPVGISPDLIDESGFDEIEISLNGGALYIFTDGVTEGYTEGHTELGVDGLKSLLDETSSLPASARLAAVTARIRGAGGDLRDDITLLAIEITA